jgi:hypothetical protein
MYIIRRYHISHDIPIVTFPDRTNFGPTSQSLAYYSAVGTSASAVDGKRDIKPDTSCAKTAGYGKTEWWHVDFRGFYNLSSVDVYTSSSASGTCFALENVVRKCGLHF